MTTATARAGINIALVKYWGKRDDAANLPAVGSLSMTLDAPGSTTTVRFDPALAWDAFVLDEQRIDDAGVVATLDAVRAAAGIETRAEVRSVNTVPTASGLASSASGAAALGLAAWAAAGLPTEDAAQQPALLDLVRRASGSAPRSLLGGLVVLDRESTAVRTICAPGTWDLRMVVAVMTLAPKKVKSRPGMTHTRATSPYYQAWIDQHAVDLAAAEAAVVARDLPGLGTIMERSTMRMHACMLAADPPLRYMSGRSLDALDAVEQLRAEGIGAWATMDAGPHVKVLCAAADAGEVYQRMVEVPGVVQVRVGNLGRGARLVPQ